MIGGRGGVCGMMVQRAVVLGVRAGYAKLHIGKPPMLECPKWF